MSLPEKTVQVVAGGMHTVCLSESGHVRDRVAFSLVSFVAFASPK